MDIDDEKKLAIKEKQQKNFNILRELASNESNDGEESYFFGHIEDVPIGSEWATQSDCSKSGVHKPLLDCVNYGDNGACSLLLENNPQDADLGDWFTYTGDSYPAEEVEVHSLSRSSLALTKNSTSGLPVRIVRRVNKLFSSLTQHTYRYDGLYVVRKYWRDVDVLTGKKVFKCAFQRCKNQSPLPCLIEKKSDLKSQHSRKNKNTSLRKKPRKTNILLDFNKVKQNVEVDCNSTPVEKVKNYYDNNKSYKKLSKSDSNIYKECYIKVHMLSHQYLYDKYSISVNDFRKSKFNRHKTERRKKTYSLSGFRLKRNYTSDCEVTKEHKITKFSRKIRSSSLNRNVSLKGQTKNSVNLEKAKRVSPLNLNHLKKSTLRYSSKSKLDDQNIPFSYQKNSEQMQLNVDLYDNETKRDLTNKGGSTRPKGVNCSSVLQNNCDSDSDSSDLLQLRISPPIINESVGSMPSDTEEELFAGFNSKCYFYKNKVIVELNGKVHVCNEHNYFVCDENDFSVLCEDDRDTSYHDLENSEGEVYSL